MESVAADPFCRRGLWPDYFGFASQTFTARYTRRAPTALTDMPAAGQSSPPAGIVTECVGVCDAAHSAA